MAIQNDNFEVRAPKPIDARYMKGNVPYASAAEVNSTVPLTYRYKGSTHLVGSVEYWYRDGITDEDLIIKSSEGGLFGNIDGGTPTSEYGTIPNIDGEGA